MGFTDRAVLLLVLVEVTLIAVIGGALGILLAKLFTLRGDPTNGMFASFYLPPGAMATGAAMTVLVGLLAGLIPAMTAMRLQVVQALRKL